MSNASLTELFSRLGPVTGPDRVSSGSPEELLLTAGSVPVSVIPAVLSLARRGASMLRAKHAVETAISDGEARLHLTTVESLDALTAELKAAGLTARPAPRP